MRASVNATAVTESTAPHDPGSGLLRAAGCTQGRRVLRVAVAHGSPAARAALRACLDDQTGITVIGEAATGEEAVHVAASLHPDVVVIDVGLPGPGCVAATRRARAVSGAAVLVLCGDEPDPRVLAALRAGAAVMRTDSAPSDLIRALTLLGRGRPLRPRRCGRGRHSSEVPMQLPKVIEIRRGSAHGRTVAPLAAVAAPSTRLVGGLRWNSGT